MAFCGYCGAQMPDDMSFCIECGKPLIKKNGTVKNQEDELDNIQMSSQVIGNEDHELNHEENTNSDNDNTSDLKLDEEDLKRLEGTDFSERKINVPEDAVLWSTSHLGNDQNNKSEDLYQSLKTTNAKKEKADKKAMIIPLICALVFAAVAIVLIIIKLKPFDNHENDSSNTVSESTQTVSTANAREERDTTSSSSSVNSHISSSSSSSNNSTSTNSVSHAAETPKNLKIVGNGGCAQSISQFSDYAYIDFYVDIYNPNETLIAQSPKFTLNYRDASGAILATESVGVGLIMPGDTVRVFGVLSILKSDVSKAVSNDSNLECRGFSTESGFYNPIRSDEIVFSNISARGASYSGTVTGEITNKSAYDFNLSVIYAVLYKDGEIVAIYDGFTDGVNAGQTRVFEINTFDTIPAYDTIECYADVW